MTKNPHIRAVEGEQAAAAAAETSITTEPALLAEEAAAEDWAPADDWYEEPVPRRAPLWIAPTLALVAIAVWSTFFGWANRAEMLAGAPPQQWIGWITAWATPVLLVLALWLLALRSSTREAARFGNVAQLLSTESARLEERLATVNRELSLAREFLATQSRELEFLGRTATERLSEHAGQLQTLVHDNGAQVEAIASVSTSALENMNKLRDSLPVIANSARDVSNQIGGAGRNAQNHLGELVSGFERLNEFGAASERQVLSLRRRVEEALAAFTAQAEQLDEISEQRFAALREGSENFRGELDSREVEALAAIRARAESLRAELAESHELSRADEDAALESLRERLAALRDDAARVTLAVREGENEALGAWGGQVGAMQDRLKTAVEELQALDARALESAQRKLAALRTEAEAVDARLAERDQRFHEEIADRRNAFAEAEDGAMARLGERLAALDEAIAERREAQLAQMAMLAEQGEALGERIVQLGDQFARVSGQGDEARGVLAEGIDGLNAKLVESREALDGTDMAVAALTDASVRLLELIQASAKHSREDLPVAMQASEERLAEIERRADEVRALLDQARQSGEAVTDSMAGADTRSREAMAAIEDFQSRFGETAQAQVDSIERLRASVSALDGESGGVAEKVQGTLRDAIAALETSARTALASIETDQAERISSIAAQLGDKSAEAIDRAVAERGEEAIGKLDEATGRATESSREAARQLRDQLAKVNELTANLESRVLRARERAEEQVDNDFTRRVALITESLNSNAIDLTKALSTEVTDTAWTSYLRGDRGIFTRRAVRLLDNSEAREIAELYDADHDFREHVNRYIHDFESMLRVMLSTRDGNAVSVTLLSSDMGKLYVALAQAIERLRQ